MRNTGNGTTPRCYGLATQAMNDTFIADSRRGFSISPALRYSHHNDDFTVRVRVAGGAWRDLYEYKLHKLHSSRTSASQEERKVFDIGLFVDGVS